MQLLLSIIMIFGAALMVSTTLLAGIGAAWLSPLGLTVNIIFAGIVAYLGVVVGRWLFGRKKSVTPA